MLNEDLNHDCRSSLLVIIFSTISFHDFILTSCSRSKSQMVWIVVCNTCFTDIMNGTFKVIFERLSPYLTTEGGMAP